MCSAAACCVATVATFGDPGETIDEGDAPTSFESRRVEAGAVRSGREGVAAFGCAAGGACAAGGGRCGGGGRGVAANGVAADGVAADGVGALLAAGGASTTTSIDLKYAQNHLIGR